MTLAPRKVDIVFEHGVKQSVDARVLPQGWFKRADNRFLDKSGRWRRRHGFTARTWKDSYTGNSLSEVPRRLTSRDTEQLVITDTSIYSRSAQLDKFVWAGPLPQCGDIKRRSIQRYADKPARHGCVAYTNGYRLYAWIQADDLGNATSTGVVWAALYDDVTGALVWIEQIAAAHGSYPQVVATSTRFFLFYVDVPGTGTNTLIGRILDVSGTTITGFDPTLYVNTVIYNVSCVPGNRAFDVMVQGSSIYVWRTHSSGTSAVIEKYNTSLTSTANKTASRAITQLALWASANRLWLVAADAVNGTYYYTCDLAVTSISGATTINGSVKPNVMTVIESVIDSTKAYVHYGDFLTASAPTNSDYLRTQQARITSAGGATAFGDKLYHFWPATKPFVGTNGRIYCVYVKPSVEYNGIYALMDLRDDKLISASFRPEPEALMGYGVPAMCDAIYYPLPKEVTRGTAHMAVLPEDYFLESYVGSDGTPKTSWLVSQGAVVVREWKFNETTSRLPAQAQRGLMLGGLGMPVYYDGAIATELGFPYTADRDYCKIADSATVGSLTAATGVYQWCFVYEWYDQLGNRHMSQPSIPITHTMGAGKTSVDMRIQTQTVSLRSRAGTNMRILIYRTPDAGSVFYLVGSSSIAMPNNDMTTHSVTFNDGSADVTIQSHEPLYTTGGVQRNALPGSCACLIEHKGRIFTANSNTVRYSKLLRDGTPPEFSSQGQFTVGNGAAITAFGSMDDQLFIHTSEPRIWVLQYQDLGPDDLGNPPFPEPYSLPTDAACTDPRSVVTFRGGNFFRSNRTLEILPRGGGAPVPIGLAIDDELQGFPLVVAATVVPDAGHVRFLLASSDYDDSLIAVYDYDNDAWFTWTISVGVGGYSAALWNNEFVVATTDPAILREDSSTYFDRGANFYTSTLETGDIRIAGINGQEHFWKLVLLGEYRNESTLNIYASYDGGKTYDGPRVYTLNAAAGFAPGNELALEYRNNTQRTASLRLKLEDVAASAANSEGPIWNGLTLLVGVEPELRQVNVANRGV